MTTSKITKKRRLRLFRTVIRHLNKQGCRSTSVPPANDLCLYRGPKGRKCAIGALMPDESYHPALEGSLASTLPASVLKACGFSPKQDRQFADCLQGLHDKAYNWTDPTGRGKIADHIITEFAEAWDL